MAFAMEFPAKAAALTALWRADPSSQTQWGSFVQVQHCVRGRWRPMSSIALSEFRSSPETARAFLATVEREWRIAFLLNADALGARLLSIPAQGPDGFDIEVTIDGEHIRASFDGLVEEFATVSGAFVFVARGLSGDYRPCVGEAVGLPNERCIEPAGRTAATPHVLASGGVGLLALVKNRFVVWWRSRLNSEASDREASVRIEPAA